MTGRDSDSQVYTIWLSDPEVSFEELRTLAERYRQIYGEYPTILRDADGKPSATGAKAP